MATVAAPQMVSTPVKTTLFLARRSDLRLIKLPRYDRYAGARKTGEDPGQAVQFVNGRLDVPEKGPMKLDDNREADSQEILKWLKEHHLLGNVEEGFWVVDQLAPPVSEEELAMLMEHAFDPEVLREIIRQEEQGWSRDQLLRPARRQLEQVEAIVARQEAEDEAEQEPPAKPARGK